MKYNNWQIPLLAFLGIIIAFLVYRDIQRDKEMAMLMSRQSMVPGKDGRKPTDPYIQNEVKNTIIKGYRDLQICYNDFLKTNPKTTDGDLKMDWQIDTDGDVISPEVVTSPFQSDTFHNCMAKQISAWRFPEPMVKKYVTHTFKFEKKD